MLKGTLSRDKPQYTRVFIQGDTPAIYSSRDRHETRDLLQMAGLRKITTPHPPL